MKRVPKRERKSGRSSNEHQVNLTQPENFYSYRPWCDIWLNKFSLEQLEFWTRMDDLNSMNLIVRLEKVGYLRRINENSNEPRFKPEPSYYSDLKFYKVAHKNPAPSTVKPRPTVFHRPNFIKSCHRAWTSMRILHTFSASQIKICSEISELVTQEFVYQMHKTNFLRLVEVYDARAFGSENVYQLIRNTGPNAPLLCTDGVVYDINTRSIYMTNY